MFLYQEALFNNRVWSEVQNAPSIKHYKAAFSILNNSNNYDGSLLLDLKEKSDSNLRQLSKSIERYEKRKHRKFALDDDDKNERQRNRLKVREERKDLTLIKSKEFPNYGKQWSKNDLDKLKENYEAGMSVNELSLQFGRMEKSISSKLEKMGILLQ